MTTKLDKAYRAWRKAAEKGYGEKVTTPVAMERIDKRIRRLKATYDALAQKNKAKG